MKKNLFFRGRGFDTQHQETIFLISEFNFVSTNEEIRQLVFKVHTISFMKIIPDMLKKNAKVQHTSFKDRYHLMFVCLFLWGFSSDFKIFYWYGDVTITDEGLQILTYTGHSWPLSSEVSLACHTYFNSRLWWSSTRTRDTYKCCRAFSSETVTNCFKSMIFRVWDSKTQLPHARHTEYIFNQIWLKISLLCGYIPPFDFCGVFSLGGLWC